MIDLLFIVQESLKDRKRYREYQRHGFPAKTGADRLHLDLTMAWLRASIEHGQGGSASHYSLFHGKWLNPFPETTGYIIPTCFDYAEFVQQPDFRDLAIKLTHWLISVQMDNGACIRGLYDPKQSNPEPIIFNTGQNLLGFVRAFQETQEAVFKTAAIKAGDFLVASTDAAGVWDKALLRGLKHTINTRCAWALLLLNEIEPKPAYVQVAQANLNWTKEQQTDNGWFLHGSSRPDSWPNTHFIAYTCRGFLEAYALTNKKEWLETTKRTADQLMHQYEERGMLLAFWDEQWNNVGKYRGKGSKDVICVTGCIQMASVWMRLYEFTGESPYLANAGKLLDQMKALQTLTSSKAAAVGSVKGSFPVYGSYSPLKYPNWAAKFFADALMHKIRLANVS